MIHRLLVRKVSMIDVNSFTRTSHSKKKQADRTVDLATTKAME